MTAAPVVTMTIWGIPGHQAPAAVARMAWHRRALRSAGGLRFAKLLGTGDGRTFTVRDADPRHWAVLAAWDDDAAADAFAAGPVQRSWARIAREQLDVRLDPLASRGAWGGRQPFGPIDPEAIAPAGDAPVASITRARLRPSTALSFWRAVPPVSADLSQVAGLRLAVGIGESPIGLQGTFSLWSSARDLGAFAYRRAAHADVVRRTGPERWYAEELFSRFAVRSVRGTFHGEPVPGWAP